ncbi:MAG TPA: FAD-dependent monooxygenase [Acidimicrobiales bacterium]|nr:FAD-dependent monooxygenase [Acidimicrobiales bacterium]
MADDHGTVTETPVLIVGAGPVGLTLAIDLAQRGVDCLLIEQKDQPLRLPKMERCNYRSMEIYRRLGLADRIRELSFPADARMDVCVMKTMADEPLVRLTYPSVAEMKAASAACDDGSLPLEPYQVVSQYTLEPFLRSVADSLPHATVRFGCGLESFVQDDSGVTATVASSDGTVETIRAQYMVGTDGGRSTVRKALGIALEGDGGIARRNQVFFRSEKFFELCPSLQARMYFFANTDESIITVQDDLKHFSFHTSCWGDEDEIRKVMQETIGLPIDIEILAATPWTLHLLVAERYMERRVFLAGDSVHLVIPAGGLGLNTGIADAIDLSWKLAGTLQGWGGPGLLPAYEAERRPIGLRNTSASRYATEGQRTWRAAVRPYLGDDTPEGRGTEQAVVRLASVEQRKTHEMTGTEMGYRYEDSPLICAEPGDWPPDVREVYIPTSRPGARIPHMWLSDGSALQDRLGSGYTLLRLTPDAPDTAGLEAALRSYGAPLDVLSLDEPGLREVYGRDLLLLRPDLHVAWRGDAPPDEPAQVAATVTGH